MTASERGIVFTNDLDGVHLRTLPPLRAALRLIRKEPLPEVGRPVGEYIPPQGWRGVILSRWSILYHQLRSTNREALEGLAEFKKAAEDNQRQLRIAALSGRESDKHASTEQKLRESGHMDYFTDLFLNQGRRAIPWKESVVQRFLDEGLKVVHIDDDLRHGLCIARMDADRVLVYVLSNLSNHPLLLRRAGIILPKNLIVVRSFQDAAKDFAKRLSERKL